MEHYEYLYDRAKKGLALIQSENPVEYLLEATWYNNGEIASRSGLNSTTVRKIREGKKPTKAQEAALQLVWLKHVYGL